MAKGLLSTGPTPSTLMIPALTVEETNKLDNVKLQTVKPGGQGS